MHIRTKFEGGKAISRSQGGSWESRCAGAGLRVNEGRMWGPKTWESITGERPNKTYISFATECTQHVEKDRKRKATDEAKTRQRASNYAKTNDDSMQARMDYVRRDNGPPVNEILHSISQVQFQGLMLDYYRAYVGASVCKIIEIERNTRGQGTSDSITTNLWMTVRRKHITASNFGIIAKCRSTTKVGALVKTLLYNKFRGNVATAYGHEQESATRSTDMQAKAHAATGITTHDSGLTIHPGNKWLAASPDGLVNDPTYPDPLGIVEYKNPYKFRNMTLVDAATQSKDFCLAYRNGSLHLNYYQIQATMFCTQRKWCDIVVRTLADIHIEQLNWDSAFWYAIMPKLRDFYFNVLLPKLAVPTLHRGGIREPSSWMKDGDTWKRDTKDL